MTLPAPSFRLLRNLVIAVIIALTIALAPIVRADTVQFVRDVFDAGVTNVIVRADPTQ